MGNELDNLYSQIELLKGEIELQERNYKAALDKYSSYPKLKKIKARIKDLKSRLDNLVNKDE